VKFLDTVYIKCESTSHGSMWVLFTLVFVMLCAFCCQNKETLLRELSQRMALKEKSDARLAMVANNSRNLQTLDLSGTYTENGQTQPTKYHLVFDGTGMFTGEAEDDDGTAPVNGTMDWPSGAPSGKIAWSENPRHAVMEVWGTIADEAGDGIKVQAAYLSSYQRTSGQIVVRSIPRDQTFVEMLSRPFRDYIQVSTGPA